MDDMNGQTNLDYVTQSPVITATSIPCDLRFGVAAVDPARKIYIADAGFISLCGSAVDDMTVPNWTSIYWAPMHAARIAVRFRV